MGKKLFKFIKGVLFGLGILFAAIILSVSIQLAKESKTTKTQNVVEVEKVITEPEYTKEDILSDDELCWTIVVETEKALNNLIEISGQYDKGQISKNDMYTLCDKVYNFAAQKKSDLRSIESNSGSEYKKVCQDYVNIVTIIADEMKVYLEENKQKALTDAKYYISNIESVSDGIVKERINYLVESGIPEADIDKIINQ